MARDSDLSKLHPIMRKKVKAVLKKLEEEQIPFKVFEAYRTPKRQAYLYAQGRTREGNKVTNANAWKSMHQYGVAADFVLFINNSWSWSEAGVHGQWWSRLQEIGAEVGLKHLSFEKPHLQLAGVTLANLRAGRYPEGGDKTWAENIAEMIEDHPNGSPPVPLAIEDRPPLNEDEPDDDDVDPRGGHGGGGGTSACSMARYRVIARSGLRMREGPGTSYDIIGTLGSGTRVYGMGSDGDWIKVDVEGDGQVDGYCHSGYLKEL